MPLILFHANNKGVYQPVLPHSLISAFVIHFLNSKIAIRYIFWLFKILDSLHSWVGQFEYNLVAKTLDRLTRK